MKRTILSLILFLGLLLLFLRGPNCAVAEDCLIAQSGQAKAVIQIGEAASEQDKFAAEEIQHFIHRFTGVRLEIPTNRRSITVPTVIVLGTPGSNPAIRPLLASGALRLDINLGDEGYTIKTIRSGGTEIIAIAGHTSQEAIYGIYALIEACIRQLTRLSLVNLDFVVQPVPDLTLPFVNETSRPFYPVRGVLEIDDPD